MHPPELVIRGRRVVTENSVAPASVHITRGYITSVSIFEDVPAGCDLVEAAPESIVMPGLVDTHVHCNEPGRTDWEGFDTATRAAAAGGITTIVDMPLNSIPATTTVAALEAKRQSARGRCHIDAAFWGGVVPGNAGDIEPLIDGGVRGFKCFLVPSGVDEFAAVDEAALRTVLPVLARRGVPLLVHAELPEQLRAHAGGVDAIAAAHADGIHISGETCPHYLSLVDHEIADGATEFKCAPPIRTAQDRDA